MPKLTIIRSDRKSLSLQLRPDEILVRAPRRMKDEEILRFVNSKKSWIEKHLSQMEKQKQILGDIAPLTQDDIKALTEKAKKIIPERVAYYAERLGVTYGRITIRCQKTRWGSCSSAGNLNFNCLLMLFPLDVIDSVVIHELCHRKHMNHSAEFYAEVEGLLPEYRQLHKKLDEKGRIYLNLI